MFHKKFNTIALGVRAATLLCYLSGSVAPNIAAASLWDERKQAAARLASKNDSPQQLGEFAAAQTLPERDDLRIPSELGKIIESHGLEKDPEALTIIHVQDAHGHLVAQKNLAEILRVVADSERLRTVRTLGTRPSVATLKAVPFLIAAEGAANPVFTEWISALPGPALRNRAAEDLLQKNLITGEEYLAVIEGPEKISVHGAEEESVFRNNVAARRLANESRNEILNVLALMEQEIEARRGELGNGRLAELGEAAARFEAGQANLASWIGTLETQLSDAEARKYPHFDALRKIVRIERNLDTAQVERQRDAFIREAAERMQGHGLRELAELNVKFRLGRVDPLAYYEALRRGTKTVGQNAPELENYTEYLRALRGSDWRLAFKELRTLGDEVMRRLAQNERESDWVDAFLRQNLERKFWSERMTPEEWGELKSCGHSLAESGVSRRLAESYLKAASPRMRYLQESYYELARQRDRALAEKCVNLALKSGRRKAALVAGGFHTEGITQYLKERGIAYAVIAPRLDRAPNPAPRLIEPAPFAFSEADFMSELRARARSPLQTHRGALRKIIRSFENQIIKEAAAKAAPAGKANAASPEFVRPARSHALRNPSRLDVEWIEAGSAPVVRSLIETLRAFPNRPTQSKQPQPRYFIPPRNSFAAQALRMLAPAAAVPLALFGFPSIAWGHRFFEEDGRTKVEFEPWTPDRPEENTLWGVSRQILEANGNPSPSGPEILAQVEILAKEWGLPNPNQVLSGSVEDITSQLSGPDSAAALLGAPTPIRSNAPPAPSPVSTDPAAPIPIPSAAAPAQAAAAPPVVADDPPPLPDPSDIIVGSVPGTLPDATPESVATPAPDLSSPHLAVPDHTQAAETATEAARGLLEGMMTDPGIFAFAAGLALGIVIASFFSEDIRRKIRTGAQVLVLGPQAAHRHGAGENHGHSHGTRRSLGKLGLALILTSAFAGAELWGSAAFNSHTLWTDGWHMVSDSAGMLAAIVAGAYVTAARRRPREEAPRTYGGHHSIEIIAGAFSSAALLGVGIYTLGEIWESLLNPAPVRGLEVLAVSLLGMGVNLLSLRLIDGTDVAAHGARLHVVSDLATSLFAVAAGLIIGASQSLGSGPDIHAVDPLLALVPTLWTLSWALRLGSDCWMLFQRWRKGDGDSGPDDTHPPHPPHGPGSDPHAPSPHADETSPAVLNNPFDRTTLALATAIAAQGERRNLILIHADGWVDPTSGNINPRRADVRLLRSLCADDEEDWMVGIVADVPGMGAESALELAPSMGVPASRIVMGARTPEEAARWLRSTRDFRVKESRVIALSSPNQMRRWRDIADHRIALQRWIEAGFEIRLSGPAAREFADHVLRSGWAKEEDLLWENGDLLFRCPEGGPESFERLWESYQYAETQA